MGISGTEDPMDKGLVSDRFHPTPERAILIAELFRELGYAFAPIVESPSVLGSRSP